MKDFLGQPIEKGCWLATSGGGNVKCEYGMILLFVEEVKEEKITALRLSKDRTRKVTISKPTKYVVVKPPEHATQLFNIILSGYATDYQKSKANDWIFGKQVF